MSNVTVQEALKSIELAEETGNLQDLINALNLCKAALAEIDKCKPVGRVEHRKDTTQYGLMYTHLPAGTKLYTSPISKEREGWVSVPIEPTEEMLMAGCEAGLDIKTLMDDEPFATDKAVYKAMIKTYINK